MRRNFSAKIGILICEMEILCLLVTCNLKIVLGFYARRISPQITNLAEMNTSIVYPFPKEFSHNESAASALTILLGFVLTLLYYTVLYCTVLYCTVLYCTMENMSLQDVILSK